MSVVPKLATANSSFRRPAFFYNSAREGFHDFLRHYCTTPEHGVLLPAFVGWSPREGSGVFDPVRNLNLTGAFYDLRDDLSVDVERLSAQAATGRFSVLVVIHYYGRSEPRIEEIRALAHQHHLVLVEDLAHGLFTALRGGPAGRCGDLSLFSLHKMLPLPNGGLVTYNNSHLATGLHQSRPDLATELLSYDLAAIAQRRRRNFLGLTQRLLSLPQHGRSFRLIWPRLNEFDVPQTLPVYIEGDRRDQLYAQMNERGIGAVSLYHTLVEEVQTTHPNMVELSNHVMNLPCHQDLAANDFDSVVSAFRGFLEDE